MVVCGFLCNVFFVSFTTVSGFSKKCHIRVVLSREVCSGSCGCVCAVCFCIHVRLSVHARMCLHTCVFVAVPNQSQCFFGNLMSTFDLSFPLTMSDFVWRPWYLQWVSFRWAYQNPTTVLFCQPQWNRMRFTNHRTRLAAKHFPARAIHLPQFPWCFPHFLQLI